MVNSTYVPEKGDLVWLDSCGGFHTLMLASGFVDFFDKILGMDFYNGFFSNGSCLDHFYCNYDDDKKKKIEQGIIGKVKSTYGVDITGVYDSKLPDLFKFIIDNRKF